MDFTPAERELLFYALLWLTLLCALFGGMGWLADWLERNVKWGKDERRQFGRFMDKRGG